MPPGLSARCDNRHVEGDTLCMTTEAWTPHLVRVLAVRAGVDPRTAKKWLDGLPVTSTCAGRIEEAWLALKRADSRGIDQARDNTGLQ